MDLFDELLNDNNERDEEIGELTQLFVKHVPGGSFQIILSNGQMYSLGVEILLDKKTRDHLIEGAAEETGTFYYKSSESVCFIAVAVERPNAVLICLLPEWSQSREKNQFITSVQLLLELHDSKRKHDEELKLMRIQKDQMKRENYALEQEFRVILNDLIQSRETAESASIMKKEFLANISHEMRTPLNGIIGMADLVMDTELDDEQKELIETINIEAKSLHNLINDVLDFSKLDSGKFDLEEILFDPRHMLDDLMNSFAYRAEQKGLELIAFFSPDIPLCMFGDPGRLRQVIANLLSNALKFTLNGEIFVKIEVLEEYEEKIELLFTIKDTGIGIPDEVQESIFEPFIQADGSTTRKFGGTGLGTTISRQLVELMEGEIGFESKEGEGSTFWFNAVFKRAKKQEALLSREEYDLSEIKVMVVNAKHHNRFVMSEYLKSWECIPLEAESGGKALTQLKKAVRSKECCDLVVTGIEISDMNGFDLAKEIRADQSLKDVPIVILTALGWRGDGKRCRDIGINGYLTKPVRQEDFYKVIVSVMGCSGRDRGPKGNEVITKHTIAEEDANKIRILLVEDHPTNQKVVIRYLSKAGYRVDIAENGLQGVKAYKRKIYNMILMDMQMPVMDGYDATKTIRTLESELGNGEMIDGRPIPIIAMTAHAAKSDREKCLEAGTDDYITKPMSRETLLSVVAKWTELNRRTADLQDESPDYQTGQGVRNDSPMDFEMMMEQYDNDKESLVALVSGFLEETREQIKAISKAVEAGDAVTVRDEAHSIKGSAALITANELSVAAHKLQDIGSSGDLEESESAVDKLESEFHRLDAYVKGV